MQTVKQTSPQGVEIEMIEAPAAMRPSFSPVSAAGLTVKALSSDQLTDDERASLLVQSRLSLWKGIMHKGRSSVETAPAVKVEELTRSERDVFAYYLRRVPGGAA